MDESSKLLIATALGGAIAIVGGIITKALEFWFAILKENRESKRHRREKAYSEIEALKDEVGKLYELSANWNAYEAKLSEYARVFANDHELIGKYNKYPHIAAAARDTVHWCKIVASDEREHDRRGDLIQHKKQLQEQYQFFIEACDKWNLGK